MNKPIRTHVEDFDDVRRALEKIDGILVSGGTVNELQSKGVRVGDADIRILDFGKHFDLTESPNRDMNISLRSASVTPVTGVSSYSGDDFNVVAGDVTLKNTVRIIFASTASDSIANTTAETAFAPAGVGSPTIAANSLKVGDVIRVTASGILSTV